MPVQPVAVAPLGEALGEKQRQPAAHRGADQHLRLGGEGVEDRFRLFEPARDRAVLEAALGASVAGIVEARRGAAFLRRPEVERLRLASPPCRSENRRARRCPAPCRAGRRTAIERAASPSPTERCFNRGSLILLLPDSEPSSRCGKRPMPSSPPRRPITVLQIIPTPRHRRRGARHDRHCRGARRARRPRAGGERRRAAAPRRAEIGRRRVRPHAALLEEPDRDPRECPPHRRADRERAGRHRACAKPRAGLVGASGMPPHRRPFVTTYHGIYGETNALKRLYNSVMVRGAAVIANSRYTAELIRARYCTPAGKDRSHPARHRSRSLRSEKRRSGAPQCSPPGLGDRPRQADRPQPRAPHRLERPARADRGRRAAAARRARRHRCSCSPAMRRAATQYRLELERLIAARGLEGRVQHRRPLRRRAGGARARRRRGHRLDRAGSVWPHRDRGGGDGRSGRGDRARRDRGDGACAAGRRRQKGPAGWFRPATLPRWPRRSARRFALRPAERAHLGTRARRHAQLFATARCRTRRSRFTIACCRAGGD